MLVDEALLRTTGLSAGLNKLATPSHLLYGEMWTELGAAFTLLPSDFFKVKENSHR